MSLLDDPCPIVRTALVSELQRWEDSGIVLLREIAKDQHSELAACAQAFLQELSDADPVKAFYNFIHSYSYELETGSLMLSKTLGAKVDVGACCSFLDEVADRCKELFIEGSSPMEYCRVLNRVLFHEYGFVGDVEHMDNPANTFIHSVIKRRRGVPISLCIIYLLVAYRCNIALEPVALPWRFLLGCYLGREPFFIDVFERGAFRSFAGVELLSAANGVDFHPSHLAPISVADVLKNCCRNLAQQYTERKQKDNAQVFSGFLHEFDKAYHRHA